MWLLDPCVLHQLVLVVGWVPVLLLEYSLIVSGHFACTLMQASCCWSWFIFSYAFGILSPTGSPLLHCFGCGTTLIAVIWFLWYRQTWLVDWPPGSCRWFWRLGYSLRIFAAYSVENHNEVQAVLDDMKLMQRAALLGYCSAPLKLVPVDGVKLSVVDYPFLDLDCCFKMYTWCFTCPFWHMPMH